MEQIINYAHERWTESLRAAAGSCCGFGTLPLPEFANELVVSALEASAPKSLQPSAHKFRRHSLPQPQPPPQQQLKRQHQPSPQSHPQCQTTAEVVVRPGKAAAAGLTGENLRMRRRAAANEDMWASDGQHRVCREREMTTCISESESTSNSNSNAQSHTHSTTHSPAHSYTHLPTQVARSSSAVSAASVGSGSAGSTAFPIDKKLLARSEAFTLGKPSLSGDGDGDDQMDGSGLNSRHSTRPTTRQTTRPTTRQARGPQTKTTDLQGDEAMMRYRMEVLPELRKSILMRPSQSCTSEVTFENKPEKIEDGLEEGLKELQEEGQDKGRNLDREDGHGENGQVEASRNQLSPRFTRGLVRGSRTDHSLQFAMISRHPLSGVRRCSLAAVPLSGVALGKQRQGAHYVASYQQGWIEPHTSLMELAPSFIFPKALANLSTGHSEASTTKVGSVGPNCSGPSVPSERTYSERRLTKEGRERLLAFTRSLGADASDIYLSREDDLSFYPLKHCLHHPLSDSQRHQSFDASAASGNVYLSYHQPTGNLIVFSGRRLQPGDALRL